MLPVIFRGIMNIIFQANEDFASILRTSGFEDYSEEYHKRWKGRASEPHKAYCWNPKQYTRRKIIVFGYGNIELWYSGILVFCDRELPLKIFINFAASQETYELGKAHNAPLQGRRGEG